MKKGPQLGTAIPYSGSLHPSTPKSYAFTKDFHAEADCKEPM